MADLLHNIFQYHYIHLLPPIIDQIHVPPNQDLTSLATACCEHITHLTAPLSPTLDLIHRHLITLTTALLLYSPPTRTPITSLLLSPLIYHLTCVITQQHMSTICYTFHTHITWFDLANLDQCIYNPSPPPTPHHPSLPSTSHTPKASQTPSIPHTHPRRFPSQSNS